MTLDTGASGTQLSVRYYDMFKDQGLDWKETDEEVGGAGGTVKHKAYEERLVILSFGIESASLKDVSIVFKRTNAGLDELYGNLGQDLFDSFDHVTFDCSAMTLGLGRK
jgi:hypothetical protein